MNESNDVSHTCTFIILYLVYNNYEEKKSLLWDNTDQTIGKDCGGQGPNLHVEKADSFSNEGIACAKSGCMCHDECGWELY